MAQSTAAVKKRKGILGGIALLAMVAGLYWSLFIAPPDAYQGEVEDEQKQRAEKKHRQQAIAPAQLQQ